MASKLPSFDQLMNPLLKSLRALGGSGSVEEIYDKIVELEHLPEDVLAQLHDPEKSNQSEAAYRLAWARTYLKKYGVLENSSRGIWSLTGKANEIEQLNPQEVVRTVRAVDKRDAASRETDGPPLAEVSQEQEWKQKLYGILTQELSPAAFERLVQRLLRESGFTHGM
jgi:restriction system protein